MHHVRDRAVLWRGAQSLLFASFRMLNELIIDGALFVAAKKAAARAGITPDYLTRWCREGRVQARRLAGGVWFVSIPSLENHLAEKEARKEQWCEQLRAERREEHASFA